MQRLVSSAFEPTLPAHCEPVSDFLLHLSSTFHVCIPTPLAFVSTTLGNLSIVVWLFAQLPQIYKNWSISSTSGLSILFLTEWFLGDLGNVLGALFTHQATWQVTIGAYYVFVDTCLLSQWLWYEKLRHGRIVRRIWPKGRNGGGPWSGDGMDQVVIQGVSGDSASDSPTPDSTSPLQSDKPPPRTTPRIIFRTPTFDTTPKRDAEKPSPSSSSLSTTPGGTTIPRIGPSSPLPSPSPRTILLIACLAALAQASPASPPSSSHITSTSPSPKPWLETAGTLLSWFSTLLYLGSRLPQILKNLRRKSTVGLSPQLFAAAFLGNLCYSSAILTNPNAWADSPPFGSRGWVGANGNVRKEWVAAALPFWLGAAGVLALDACVGVQFWMYHQAAAEEEEVGVVVVLQEDDAGRGTGGRKRRRTRLRWRQVSGWMRGWVPSASEPGKVRETEALLGAERGAEETTYGAA